jgi:hypothetical protein
MDNDAQSLTLLEGFDAVREFIEAIFRSSGQRSDDLAMLLSAMDRVGGRPLDIAQWHDWLEGVMLARPDLNVLKRYNDQALASHMKAMEARKHGANIPPASPLPEISEISLSSLEAFEAMRHFLTAFWKRGREQSVDIAAILNGPAQHPSARWQAAIELAKGAMN